MCITSKNKKADVTEPPRWEFRHVGLLIIAPTDISRVALYLVVRIESPKSHPETHHDSRGMFVSFVIQNAIRFWYFCDDFND